MVDEQQTLDQQTLEQSTDAVEDLAARVQKLEEQLAAVQDQALRMITDLQNVRRRVGQDAEKVHKFASEKFIDDLLAVADILEHDLEMPDPNGEAIEPMREGMELTLEILDDILRHYQVEVLNPEDEPLNPKQHQAVVMQESASARSGNILKVSQKSYLLSGRLLRPTMMAVNKAPAEVPPSADGRA